MKKNILVGILFMTGLSMLISSCDEWLDVKPKAEVESDELFETESGFKDALIGVYLSLTDNSVYGKEMTFGFMDVLAQQYDMARSNSYYYVKSYMYTDDAVCKIKDKMWAGLYNSIANINNILEQIEAKGDVMHPNVRALIKGECLGLRAYLHFDLLRIWGFGNLEANPASMEKLTIPYATKFEKHAAEQLTEAKVLECIEADLEEARMLMESIDPYSYYPKEVGYSLPDENGFFENRQVRFNYCAVRATQARVYLWEGKYEEAYACASEVGNRCDPYFPWTNTVGVTDRNTFNKLFSTEHIFALTINNIYDRYKDNLQLAFTSGENPEAFYLSAERWSALYPGGDLISDFRREYHFDVNQVGAKEMLKFVQGETYANKDKDRMPMIRRSEMFYIMAECLNRKGDDESRKQAIACLNTVRRNRNISSNLRETLTQAEVTAEIQKEYQKEFVSEGQLFYFYKRLGALSITGTNAEMNNHVYVLPIPDVELEFGGRVDTDKD
ncbi:MAG: RagB/SusD family nutrient uptake outer membrane protein [Prevotella sp.]